MIFYSLKSYNVQKRYNSQSQNEPFDMCAQHPRSLITVFVVRLKKLTSLAIQAPK